MVLSVSEVKAKLSSLSVVEFMSDQIVFHKLHESIGKMEVSSCYHFRYEKQFYNIISDMLPKMFKGLRVFYSSLNTRPNLYSLLELKPTAKPQEIQFNYYRLLKKYQATPGADPEKQAKLINQAYIILSNQKLRQKYDKENGFVKADQENGQRKSSDFQNFSGRIDSEKEYRKAKNAFSSVLGDKVERQQRILFAIIAFLMFSATVMILFGQDPKKRKKPGLFDGLMTKQTFQTSLRGNMQ